MGCEAVICGTKRQHRPSVATCFFEFYWFNVIDIITLFVFKVISGVVINPLTPNDPYSGRTAPLTSKRCILYILFNKYRY